jgi:Na+/proline symporter
LTAIAGAVALGVAASGGTIKGLVEIASSFGSAGIVVALLFGLHTKFGDERAAVAALIAGVTLSFFGDGVVAWALSLFMGEEIYETIPAIWQGYEGSFLFSVLGALVAYISVAWFTSRRMAVAAAD